MQRIKIQVSKQGRWLAGGVGRGGGGAFEGVEEWGLERRRAGGRRSDGVTKLEVARRRAGGRRSGGLLEGWRRVWVPLTGLLAVTTGLIAAELPYDVGTEVAGYQDDFRGDDLSLAWQRTGSSFELYTVRDGVLQVSSADGDPNHLIYEVPGYDAVTQEVLARIRIRFFGTGDPARGGVAVGVDPFTSQGINYHFRDVDSEGQFGRHTSFLDDFRAWGPGYDFKWENDTWYWVRLRQDLDAASEGGAADLFAKVWLADGTTPEPAIWEATDYVPSRPLRSGYAGIAAGSLSGLSEFEVDYILIKAAGLPQIVVAPDAFPLFETGAVIVEDPVNMGVAEGSPAKFEVKAEGYPMPTYQWYRDDLPLEGETNTFYEIAAARFQDDGARFRAEARNVANEVEHIDSSETAVLSVTPDLEPPELLGAASAGLTVVEVRFSERLEVESATEVAHYGVMGTGGQVSVLSAVLDGSGTTVILSVTPLVEGASYTLTAEGVRDESAMGNLIPAGTSAMFIATSYRMTNIGGGSSGELTAVPGGYDVTAAGAQLGGVIDSCFFASLPRTGDFDVRVRVEAFGPGEVWAMAGLMARSSGDPGAPFAAVFGTPANVGSGFMTRLFDGASAWQQGYFPVNYPNMWLRLRRTGMEWEGYASHDGREWKRLGWDFLDLGETVDLGFVVTSQHAERAVDASFRDYGAVTESGLAESGPAFEPLLQSSRLTPIVISEIMYHPVDAELEYIELANTFATAEDLSGYRLSGEIDFEFPPNTVLEGGAFVVVARDPAALQGRYGITNVVGPYPGALSNGGGTLRLRHRTGAVFLEVEYGTETPWPRAADGAGHSLVLSKPSLGENDVRAWSISDLVGGSPGFGDGAGVEPLRSVVINEILAHTDDPELDFIELYNHGKEDLDLSGCILTDRRGGVVDGSGLNVFRVPDGTTIPARGYVVFDQEDLGFSLSAAGETIYFANPGRTRVLDALAYGGQANGVTSGRWPDAAPDIYPLKNQTPGAPNAEIRTGAVVINEIMYAPISGSQDDEYVELHNPGNVPVDIGGWRFDDGIEFEFPGGTMVPAGGYLVAAKNREHLLSRYDGVLTSANTVGNYAGALSNSGERVRLSQPELLVSTNALGGVESTTSWILVDEVSYRDGGRWGQWSDGGGSSLEKVDPRADGRRPESWADSEETAKAPWTTVSYIGRLDHGDVPADQLQVLMMGAGECLIDDIEVLNASSQNVVGNSTFAAGAAGWTAEGTQSPSGWSNAGGFGDNGGCYHLRAVSRGDNQINRLRTQLTSTPAVGTTATFRARVRWIRGHPEILLRLRGKWLETVASLETPGQPGTPGQANSRRLANAGPAIYDVAHFPVLPQAGEDVLVSTRAQDPDGVSVVQLRYRIDPGLALQSVTMRDDGTAGDLVGGDGVYSARIPGQGWGDLVAFHVRATDGHGSAATSLYPNDAPASECLVRFGEQEKPGSIPSYRLWMTAATFNAWTARNKLDNTPSEITFVLGNHRVVHQVQAGFAGSPYIAPSFNTPAGSRCGYSIEFPSDDLFLGDSDLVLDWPGGHGNENTAVQEQMAYWLADRMGLPYSLRHFIRLSVNGVTDMDRGGVFEAIIQPNRDFVEAWSPDDTDGEIYKIDRAFEFSNGGTRIADPMPTLEVFETTGGAKKTARYRWNWLKRSYDSAIDFTNIFELVDAANAPSPEPYTSRMTELVELEDWMGMFAFEHIINNFDSWGHDIGKNMYVYKPVAGPWQLYAFDLDWLMLVAGQRYSASNGPLFVSQDPTVERMYEHPPFRRAYFRGVEAALGPMAAGVSGPVMDAKYRWLLDEGVTLCDGAPLAAPTAVKQWFAQRRTFLENQLTAVAASFTIDGPASFVSATNPVMLTGTAPIELKTVWVNGVAIEPTWTSVNAFRLSVPMWQPRTNVLELVGHGADDEPIPGAVVELTVDYVGPPLPEWNRLVRLNEWMAANSGIVRDPADDSADDWFELYNTGTGPADLSGFFLTDDLAVNNKWQVPDGTVISAGGFLLVWADGEPTQNGQGSDLHADFQLGRGGESIGLFAPDGGLVDSVTFGLQVDDLSEGRYADGGVETHFLTSPTPGGPNAAPYLGEEAGPRIEPNSIRIESEEIRFGWLSTVGKVYQLFYTDDLSEAEWTALGPARTAVLPVMEAVDGWGEGPQRYYRVVESEGPGP